MEMNAHFGDARGIKANAKHESRPMILVCNLPEEHNLPPDLAAHHVEATISRRRKRAQEETTTIPQIYDDALQGMDDMQKNVLINAHAFWGVLLELELHTGFYMKCTHFSEA